jgi:hypothetical protein
MADVKIIRVPNKLAVRIGPRTRVFTATLLKRAEAAFAQVASKFDGWLQDDLRLLEAAMLSIQSEGISQASLRRMENAARQLQSSGSAFGYPNISRVSASLLVLAKAPAFPMRLMEAHVDAIRAASHMKGDAVAESVASQTCGELEARVAELRARTASAR